MIVIEFKVHVQKVDDNELKDTDEGNHEPEDVITEESCEKIEFVVDASTVEEVEDLHEDEDVEDEGEMARVDVVFLEVDRVGVVA